MALRSALGSVLGSGLRSTVAGAGAGGAVPSFPVTPLIDLDSGDISGSNLYVPNRQAAAPPTNAIALNSGLIQGAVSTGTVTQAYANGPGGQMTAMRLQMTSGAGIFDFFNRTLANNTTFQFKARSTAGAGNQTFRYGDFSDQVSVGNVTEAGWTTLAITITAGTTKRISIAHNSTNTDILIDEIQLVEGASAGTFANSTSHGYPEQGLPTPYTKTNGALDTSAAAVKSTLILPSYPLTTTFSEGTFWAIFSTADTTTTSSKIIGASGADGTADVGHTVGNAFGAPALPRTGTDSLLRLISKGYHVVISTWKAGAQTFYIDGVPHTITTNTLSNFSRAALGFLGDPYGVASSTWGNFGFKGKMTKAGVSDSWITDAQAQALYNKLVADHAAIPSVDALVLPINFVIADGDSITAGTNANSYARVAFNTITSQTLGKVTAVASTTLQNPTTGSMARKAAAIQRVEAAVALGHNPIYSVFHGANGTYSMSEAHALTDDIRAAGAKILYCTPIHEVGDAAHNAIMDTLTADLIAEGSSLYDALARFDGVLTETVGVDYVDAIHPNNTGIAKLAPVWDAALTTLLV